MVCSLFKAEITPLTLSPRRQSIMRSFVRYIAVIMRTRLCIQPDVAGFYISFLVVNLGNIPIVFACRIPASTMGTPVRPAVQASKCSGFDSQCTSAYFPWNGSPIETRGKAARTCV